MQNEPKHQNPIRKLLMLCIRTTHFSSLIVEIISIIH